jgi:hypothetical protein
MRTSGAAREGWMTAIPLAVILLFALIVTGGPEDLLKWMERSLEKVVTWVSEMAS